VFPGTDGPPGEGCGAHGLSRAVAGTWKGQVLFLMPGSPSAVRLALERLILPELPHVAGLVAAAEGPVSKR